MSVGQLPPPRARQNANDARLVQYDQYIDTQIHATRRAVKAVDWAIALVVLVAGVIAFLLAVAVVEHWLVPGGFSVPVRTALFLCLVGTLCHYAYRRLWPLCHRAINPVYAAQTIERQSPALKNSLINLLLFRQNREQISEAVYHTLEEQAAHGLTRVPIEAAVDRSLLIRVGYVLLAVVALAGLYKVLSPKDPLVAAERVLFPWSEIVPASRVSISAVTPGAVTRARGEFVDVSAEVRGIDEDDPVLLRYTTADGQAVDQAIQMNLSKDGLRFEARLPDDGNHNEKLGLAQNLHYRIEAGDARTLDYAVTVVPAPSMLVERVEYDYPDYTGFLDREVEGLGDIRAIEGTRVTVHARANSGINEAHVDFDADGRPDSKMATQGTDARVSFDLALREDRQTPRHASYVLRFTNADGRPNRDPVKHPIAVEPDLVPEAEILLPEEQLLDVQLNDTVTIEVEARDPDFALSEVRLRGEVAGRAVIDHELLTAKHTGRFTARHQFTPSGHDLRPGDIVEYWVVASDNRSPDANTAKSKHKQLRIASPEPGKQPPPDRIARNDQRREQGQGDKGTRGQGDGQRPDGEAASAGGEGKNGEAAQQNKQSEQNKNREQTGAGAPGGESSSRNSQPDGTRPDQKNTQQQSDGQRQRGGEQRQSNEDANPVSSDGDNDAEAFNRIREHMKQSGELKDSGSESADSNEFSRDEQESGEPGQGDKETRRQGDGGQSESQGNNTFSRDAQRSTEGRPGVEKSRDGEPTSVGMKNDANEKQHNGDKSQTAQPDKQAPKEQGESAPQQQAQGESSQEPGTRAQDQGKAPGAESKPHDPPDDAAQPHDGGKQDKSPGGQQTSSKGPSGAGNEQQSQGAPNSQPEMKPTEKHQQSGTEKQTDKEEPSAGARGKQESDSQGEEGGDKAGGGEEGGGQKAPREGTGSAGQNQSADEGAGESSEKGAGNTSGNAGQDATADRRTGQSGGETTGRGSKTREAADGKIDSANSPQFSREPQASAEQGQGDKETRGQGDGKSTSQHEDQGKGPSTDKPPNGEPTSVGGKEPATGKEPRAEDDPARSEETNPDQRGGTPSGDGNEQGVNESRSSSSQGDAPPADAANLDYAKKQTDLVLDKLAEQLNRKQVDTDLLKKLGWTEDDLRRFVNRWQQLKGAARQADPSGESTRELDEALRSLGLRRGSLQQGPVRDDAQRDMRQGYRGPVPRQYQDRLRAYNQGVSRARESE